MKFSESIKEISKALIKLQEEIANPKKNHTNPFIDNCTYAKLEDIINDVQPILFKNGLKLIQDVTGNGESVTVSSMLLHSSGEWISTGELTLKNTANKKASASQEAGISITYARRYQLQGLLGINSEDDNDGNGDKNPAKPKQKYNNNNNNKNITLEQAQQHEFKTKGGMVKGIDMETKNLEWYSTAKSQSAPYAKVLLANK